MKKPISGIVAASLIATSLNMVAQNKDNVVVQSKLNEATVFFQGAELTHTASSNLTKGENEIIIEGLSPSIDKNSLKIKTSNGVVVSASEFSIDFLAASKAANVETKKLEDSIAFYTKKLEQINTETKITNSLIDLLQKGTEKNVSGSEKGLGIDDLMTTIDYYKTKSTELQTNQSKQSEEKKKYETSIERLRKQHSQESLKNSKSSGTLKLTLSSPVSAVCNFTISYYTIAANWTPFYNINVESIEKPIKIQARSKVRQTTGLDWEKVKLTLSSANPSNGKIAPLFNAWFLEYYKPRPSSGKSFAMAQNSYSYAERVSESAVMKEQIQLPNAMRQNDAKNQSILYLVDGVPMDADYVSSIDPNMIKDRQVLTDPSVTNMYGEHAANGVIQITLKSDMDDYITEKETELNMAYEIDLPYTIPGNGKEQIIDLQTKETTAEYKYYCAPKLDIETYLLAEISNWEKLNLLSGKANITYDGTYVGETFINAGSTHKKLTLTLGTDKRVSVKREKLQDYSSTKFLGSDTKQVFTYRLTVRNSQNKPIKMTLKDQYPLSTQKNIDIELITKDTTPWTANKEDLGVITWEEELNIGETKVYQISYSVKYPKEANLNL